MTQGESRARDRPHGLFYSHAQGTEGCPSGSSTDSRLRTHEVDEDEHGSSIEIRKERDLNDTLAMCLHIGHTPRGARQKATLERAPYEEEGRRITRKGDLGRPR